MVTSTVDLDDVQLLRYWLVSGCMVRLGVQCGLCIGIDTVGV